MTTVRWTILLLLACSASHASAFVSGGPRRVLEASHLVMVKVYGAGGVTGLEAYQTGCFVDGDGAVLTVDSPVLDSDRVTLVDAFGDRVEGRVVGRDTTTGLALVAPEPIEPPAFLDLDTGQQATQAESVWVLSNAFGIAAGDESLSVQRTRVAALGPIPLPSGLDPSERRRIGVPAPATPVVLFDAVTSNPGAAGGLAVDDSGRPIGVLGAECRSPLTGTWINYALPMEAVADAIERIRQDPDGDSAIASRQAPPRWRPVLRELGLAMLPEVDPQTPAFIEHADANSPAGRAGCRGDDLVVAVDGASVAEVERAGVAIAAALDRNRRVELTVLRDNAVVRMTLALDAP